MNKVSTLSAKQKAPVSEFDCAATAESLTAITIPLQIAALKDSLALLDDAWSGLGYIDGVSPESHPEDALSYLEDLTASIKQAHDVANAWFDQDARRRKEG